MKQYLKETKEGWLLKVKQAIRDQEGITEKELERKQLKPLSLSLSLSLSVYLSPLFSLIILKALLTQRQTERKQKETEKMQKIKTLSFASLIEFEFQI